MLERGIQRDRFGGCFCLSHLGDLHFGQTVGRSFVSRLSSRESHSCPHRHRHPSSLTAPSSLASFAIHRYLLYLLLVYTDGIDKYAQLNILSVYTIGEVDSVIYPSPIHCIRDAARRRICT
jgi:hypothetical protein